MHLVFLHGCPASGKLTVGRALADLLHYGVFHNHLVVDALTAVFPFGTEPFVKLREDFWLATFDAAARSGTSLIFTFAPEPTVATGFPARARDTVERAGGNIHFVELMVSEAEQERRIGLPGRKEFGKLTDVATLVRLRESAGGTEPPPADLSIDTEQLSPAEAANLIMRRFDLHPVAAWEKYPDADP